MVDVTSQPTQERVLRHWALRTTSLVALETVYGRLAYSVWARLSPIWYSPIVVDLWAQNFKDMGWPRQHSRLV